MRVFNCLGRRCCFGSTEISAVKAKVCYFCGCFNLWAWKLKKTELGQNRLLKHLQSIVDEKEELSCLLYLIQIFGLYLRITCSTWNLSNFDVIFSICACSIECKSKSSCATCFCTNIDINWNKSKMRDHPLKMSVNLSKCTKGPSINNVVPFFWFYDPPLSPCLLRLPLA